MSRMLDPLGFPLWGSRLIEASAGTGKTWTIAALYIRLVLGHGDEDTRFARPLLPGEILVMTFTRAATRELSDRIRLRLLEAAQAFRDGHSDDGYLAALIAASPSMQAQQQAAYRLNLAAEAMDEAAIFTIDAWCQRMLREHAFDSGNLFDEELLPDETELFDTAVRDYWRQQVYPLDAGTLDLLLQQVGDPASLASGARQMLDLDTLLPQASGTLGNLLQRQQQARMQQLAQIKHGWQEKAQAMGIWLEGQLARKDKPFNGRKLQTRYFQPWLAALAQWAQDPQQVLPDISESGWIRLTPPGLADAANDPSAVAGLPAEFAEFATLQTQLDNLPALKPALLQHAAWHIRQRLARLKQQAGVFSFADMLQRLDRALAGTNGAALRARILAQYPVALVDEFQDTSPLQYRLFDQLYRTADNDPASALLLIGDPKQSIYAFRGADIHSYLAARRATQGRHYALGTNYRSSHALVESINRLFALGEAYPAGAFRFRREGEDPLPFLPVAAKGREEQLVCEQGPVPAMTLCHAEETLSQEEYRRQFAKRCAEEIVSLLNDAQAGFARPDGFARLRPADIAVLVRTGKEAAAVRRALQQRKVASVYLSDKDSVFASQEAYDVLRWLRAMADPLDGRLARAALATATAGLSLTELEALTRDDLAWEVRIEQFKRMRQIWQRQGVLAMLRQWLHALRLPARLLSLPGGERVLTNLLHLAELLQAASLKQEGEQALIRWLAEHIDDPQAGGDEAIVRLESDAELVKVITIHKSKGLEYPVVFLPFACSFRITEKRGRSLYSWVDDNGERQLDFTLGKDAQAKVDLARQQEDLRLLYVALTRPRHALWLGMATLKLGNSDTSQLHQSAFGYLLAGGQTIDAAGLPKLLASLQNSHVAVQAQPKADDGITPLQDQSEPAPLMAPQTYAGHFERNWSISSFSALTRDLGSTGAQFAESLRDDANDAPLLPTRTPAGWHAFPRGPVPGNFLHDQLQWVANEGFRADALQWLPERCTRLGWGNRAEVVADWLQQVIQTPLPPLGCALAGLDSHLPEMEFWFPASQLDSGQLDSLCQAHILPGQARPALPARSVHGMVKGFADLVFEHQGKFWVLDYKSNALGEDDAAYHPAALDRALLAHRYDVQATLYLLALHRLLKQRLGAAYQPEQQLGGALYLFLRGIHAPGNGCCHLAPPLALLEQLDCLSG